LLEIDNLVYRRMWLCNICLRELEDEKAKFMVEREAYADKIKTIYNKQTGELR
jgi:hypothetical protein